MRFPVRVEVTALEGIADPEAATIERALPLLGFVSVSEMRVGKVFRFCVEAPDAGAAEAAAKELCDKLLANPVIQQAGVSVTGDGNLAGAA
ncbi:MAG: phosphoribosylformylglycinamidine synthase subunit PurS [Acidimicrobiales bacterium]